MRLSRGVSVSLAGPRGGQARCTLGSARVLSAQSDIERLSPSPRNRVPSQTSEKHDSFPPNLCSFLLEAPVNAAHQNEVPIPAESPAEEGRVHGQAAPARPRRCPHNQQRLAKTKLRLRLLPRRAQECLCQRAPLRNSGLIHGTAHLPRRRPAWRGGGPVLQAGHFRP